MTEELREQLERWAEQYETEDFIKDDPVQFPHRYNRQEDIEISGFLTALISFGNRKMILRKGDETDDLMGHRPLEYVMSEKWRHDFPRDDGRSYYRMVTRSEFGGWIEMLHGVYAAGMTLEDALLKRGGSPMEKICSFMGVSAASPQKKLNMFLRWMVRRNSAVDFGLWKKMDPAELIVPLDTHVCRMAYQLSLTDRRSYTLSTAKEITESLSKVFPGDPCKGDFALFGYGVNHK